MEEKKKVIRVEEVTDPDMMSKELDSVVLEGGNKTKGIILFLICSIIGIAVFFGQIEGSTIRNHLQWIRRSVWTGDILDSVDCDYGKFYLSHIF